MMTKDSFTEDEDLDKLVSAYLVIRIAVMVILGIMCSVQLYYDILHLKSTKKRFNSRFYVFLNLSLFPISRIVYCIFFFQTKDVDFGSPSVYAAIVATYLLFNCWCFVGFYWMQLLYTFFISKGIRHENTSRIWRLTWFLILINTIYMVAYIVVCAKAKDIASKFYTISFIVLLAIFSLTFFINGSILVVQMKRNDQKTPNSIITATRKKTKILAIGLILQLCCLVARDVVYSVLKISMTDNLRHLYTFITFFFEVFIVINIMIAVAQRPFNYLVLRPVNGLRSGISGTSDSEYSGGERGTGGSMGGSSHQKGFSGSIRLDETSSSDSEYKKKMDKEKERDKKAYEKEKEKEKQQKESKQPPPKEFKVIDPNSDPNAQHIIIPASILEGYVHDYDIFTSDSDTDGEDSYTIGTTDGVSFPIDTPTTNSPAAGNHNHTIDISMSRSPPLGAPPLP